MTPVRHHPPKLLRAAAAIHRHLAKRHEEGPRVQLPERPYAEAQRLARQIELARQRGWLGAADRRTEQLRSCVEDCHERLLELVRRLRQHASAPPLPGEVELYREIQALQEEFDGVEIDPATGRLAVTVGPIVLEGIELGRFQICLDWEPPGGSSPYRIVALDPNPASADEEVTHPHVQGERLCEGEGRAAVRGALRQGRLYDFFVIVSQILATYARGSAYVELDQWRGQRCADCDSLVDDEDRGDCRRCETVLCQECSMSCACCEESYCSACLSACEICQESFCSACLEECSGCHRATCPDCLDDRLCRSCHEEQDCEHQQDDRDASTAKGEADAEIPFQQGPCQETPADGPVAAV